MEAYNSAMNTAAAPSREYCWIFQQRSATSGGQHGSGDELLSEMDVCVIDVRVFWVPSVHGQGGPVVVQRVMSYSFSGGSRYCLPLAESSGGAPGEGGSATERLMDACDDYMAKRLVGPAWKKTSEVWVTPVCENVADLAERISGLRDQFHELVLGKPVQYLGGPPPLANIAAELVLPGDTFFLGLKRVMQIGGILVGFLSGQPLLVNACVKSLAHDVLVTAVSRGISALLSNDLEPMGTCERDVKPNRIKDKFAQQTITDFQPAQEAGSPEPHFRIPLKINDAGTTQSISLGPRVEDAVVSTSSQRRKGLGPMLPGAD